MSVTNFSTPRLFIADYYDKLINEIDIYTERLIEQYGEEDLLPNEPDAIKLRTTKARIDTDELCGEKYHQDPYLFEYIYERQIDVEPSITKVHDYLNRVREKQIDEIRKVRDHNLDMYEMNKLAYKINPSGMNEADLEQLRSRIFADKFCFLIEINKIDYSHPNKCIFKLYTVITDFYISQTNMDPQIYPSLINFNEKDIFSTLVKKYINELLANQKYGFEVIPINKQSILGIKKIILEQTANYRESVSSIRTNLNSDLIRLDLSAVKSLYLKSKWHNRELIGLDALKNLEYLTLEEFSLIKLCLNGLNNLIKLSLRYCYLNQKCLRCFGKLLLLELHHTKCFSSSSLDLRNLTNLEWFSLVGDHINTFKNLSENLFCLKVDFNELKSKDLKEFFITNKFPKLMSLSIDNTSLGEFEKKWFLPFKNLKCLSLMNNMIIDFAFLECKSLSNLEELNLSRLQTLTEYRSIKQRNFSKLANLKRLDLSGHSISEFPPCLFSNLSNLEELDLSDSIHFQAKIDKEAFFGLTNLISLNLSNINMSQLDPEIFFHTPKLLELNLQNNKLNIDKNFFSHLKNLKTILINRSNLSKEACEYIQNSNIKVN